jgi:hypothetical protein
MGNFRTYICKHKITFYLDNFVTKYLEFKQGKEYEFFMNNDVYRLKDDDVVVFGKNTFLNHFMLASEIKETKGVKFIPKEIAENNLNDFDFQSQEQNTKFFKKVMKSLKDKGKLTFQSDLELEFDTEVQSTLQKIQQLLLVKGKEYRRNSDPFHNFNIGSQISGEIPEKVLQGFLLKHLVSYQDMLNDIEQGKLPKIELVEEKLLDIIVYMVIQKAQIINRIKKS